MSASSVALDLAHRSQTSPRSSFSARTMDSREKSSEWPQFRANPRVPDGVSSRADRRTVTNPTLTLSSTLEELSSLHKLGGTVSGSATPHLAQHPQGMTHAISIQVPSSRRGSPPGTLDSMSSATRSVPTTPLGGINGAAHLIKTPGTPRTPDIQGLNNRVNSQGSHQHHDNAGELQASLSRRPSGQFENGSLSYNSAQPEHDDSLQVSPLSSTGRAFLDSICISSNTGMSTILVPDLTTRRIIITSKLTVVGTPILTVAAPDLRRYIITTVPVMGWV